MTTRIGVIGCGYWGPNLIRNFSEIAAAEIVAVADLRQDRLDSIASRYPTISTTTTYQHLFEMNLDAVAIAVPPPFHYPIAKDCLEHDLHVLVEKPMTLSTEHAEALVRLAQQYKKVLMVGHTFEYNAAVEMLKGLIDSGELGEIYYINTQRLNLGLFQRDLNVLWDLAPHDVSIVRFLLGDNPIKVQASGSKCVLEDVHDIAFMCMVFPNGVICHSRVSWLDPCKVRTVTVVGSKKMAVYDDVETQEKIKVYDKGVQLPYTDTFGEFQLHYRYGDVVSPYIRLTEPLRQECQHFIDCICNGTTPRSSGENGLQVVRILEAANSSLLDNGIPKEIEWHAYPSAIPHSQ